MSNQVNIGVVGVGHLGYHHVEHLTKIKKANLIGIYDLDSKRSNEVSTKFNVQAFESLENLLSRVDALSIVTPTSTHKSIAEQCIQNGKHVFIEKPITTNVDEADHIIKLAEKNSTIIQVGHIERFNPALLALSNLEIKPEYIEVHRMAPFMSRGTDVPVVLDLMIHDIDLVLSFISSKVKDIYANGLSIMTNSVDIANARIKFENGAIANITSSRVAKDRARKILTDHIDELHIIAKGLLDYESLTGDEVKDLIKGIKPSRDDFDNNSDNETSNTSTPKPSVPKTGGTTAPQPN